MMGGPIDARKTPDRGQQPGDEQELRLVREQRDLPRAGQLPGRRPRASTRASCSTAGFVAMNPDRHLKLALRLLPRPGARRRRQAPTSHREFYDEYNAVLDMPAEYYLDTIKTVFQDFALVNGTWDVDGELVRPQDITHHRAADDRRRARRHLRRRPDPRRARAVHRHPEGRASSTTTSTAPATTASSPAAAGARRSTRRCATSSPRIRTEPRRRAQAARRRRPPQRRSAGEARTAAPR